MNVSTETARAVVAELIRSRVRHVVLAPGSRSAPLAYALTAAADSGLVRLHVRVDERVAGFTALGLAKGSGEPAAVVTTSGTAVANLHPAVLEASYAGVPLLVISADRPAELRGTGSNQTLRAQHELFTADARSVLDIPAAETTQDVASVTEAVRAAVAVSRGETGAHATTDGAAGRPGPVHVNAAFRPPLVPSDFEGGWLERLAPEARLRGAARPDTPDVPAPGGSEPAPGSAAPHRLSRGPKTVIVAGDAPDGAAGRAALALAGAAGWPLLAEPTSGARAGSIDAYRLVLAESPLTAQIERVVTFGHPTLNRPVSDLLLARADARHIVVTADEHAFGAGVPGALCVSAVTFDDDPATATSHSERRDHGEPATTDDRDWLAAWNRAGSRAAAAVAGALQRAGEEARGLTGPDVASDVLAATTSDDVLVVGSSNPIRDVDLVMTGERTVLASRGLAGIDGTIATASGIALAAPGKRVRVLVGDLTALHDSGALLIGPLEDEPDLQIIVFNDDGGGIFATLEYGDERLAGSFERVFGTPSGVDLGHLAAAYGVDYKAVSTRRELAAELARWTPGRRIIDVRGDRQGRRELGTRISAAVRDALGAPGRHATPS